MKKFKRVMFDGGEIDPPAKKKPLGSNPFAWKPVPAPVPSKVKLGANPFARKPATTVAAAPATKSAFTQSNYFATPAKQTAPVSNGNWKPLAKTSGNVTTTKVRTKAKPKTAAYIAPPGLRTDTTGSPEGMLANSQFVGSRFGQLSAQPQYNIATPKYAPHAKPLGTPAPAPAPDTALSMDVKSVADKVAPYMSNIANALRKPPLPKMPKMISPVIGAKIDLSNQRNMVDRAARAADIAANTTLDSNTAAAVRGSNLAGKIQGMNQVNETEANMNSQQQLQLGQTNSRIEAVNTAAVNNFQDNLVERDVARQREQSANLANASDKYVAIQNEDEKRKLDLKKYGVLKDTFRNSGVLDRMMKRFDANGLIPEGTMDIQAFGGKLRKKFIDGGLLIKKLKPI